jgi:LPXTG-site transpeptidase (sortase) family protein
MSALSMDEASDREWPRPVLTVLPDPILPDTCRQFVERMVSNGIATVAGDEPGAALPGVDWDAIWRAGDGASSVESALGAIITAAYVAAREIATSTSDRAASPRRDALPPAPIAESAPPSFPVHAPTSRNYPTTPPADVREPTQSEPHLRTDVMPEHVGELFEPLPPAESDRARVPGPSSMGEPPGWSTVFTWIRNVGLLAILFVAWQLWGTSISQHHAQSQLQSSFAASVHAHHAPKPTSSGPALISAETLVPTPAEGTPVAKIEIPTIGLSEIVVSGTAEGDLAKGPGHYIGTAAPGQAGNVAIAGHRTTNGAPFNRLGDLAVGDQIFLTTLSGERLTYVVSQAPNPVSPNDVAVLDNYDDNRITLTTCNPEYSSAQRLVVVGELKQPDPPPVTKAKPQAYHVVNAKTASWDWSLLPVAILEAGVLMLLGLSNRRFASWYGGVGRWFVLAPIWAAALYALFSTLVNFLPSTF